MQTDTPTPESTRRTRRTRRIVVVLIVLVLLLAAAAVLILVPGGDQPPRQAGSSLGASRGEHYVGVVTDGQGLPTQVALTVTGDGRVSGTLGREPGARADIAATGAAVLVRGNRQWWDSERPGQAAAPVGRWVADPDLGRRLMWVRWLTPAAVAREGRRRLTHDVVHPSLDVSRASVREEPAHIRESRGGSVAMQDSRTASRAGGVCSTRTRSSVRPGRSSVRANRT